MYQKSSQTIKFLLVLIAGLGSFSFSGAQETKYRSFLKDGDLRIDVHSQKMVYRDTEPVQVEIDIQNLTTDTIELVMGSEPSYSFELHLFDQYGKRVKEREDYFFRKLSAFRKWESARPFPEEGEAIDMDFLAGETESSRVVVEEGKELDSKNLPNYQEMKFASDVQYKKLAPSARTGVSVNLQDIFPLTAGKYFLQVLFYPKGILAKPKKFIYGQDLYFNVVKSRELVEPDVVTKRIQKDDDISVIIEAFLEAQKLEDWELFFQSIHMESFIEQFQEFKIAYHEAKRADKPAVLKDFKRFLMNLYASSPILDYEIQELVIQKRQALATVIVSKQINQKVVKQEYKILLQKKYIWQVAKYTILPR